jgi:hypothetical protein
VLKRLILSFAMVLSIDTNNAHAGKDLAAGPTQMSNGDYYQCSAVNIGTKALAEVKIAVYRPLSTTPELDHTCTNLLSHDTCAFQTLVNSPGSRTCIVTVKGNKKAVRGNFCNTTDNVCFPLD